jgi:cell division protein FtsI (penicillin-binding protein 3)
MIARVSKNGKHWLRLRLVILALGFGMGFLLLVGRAVDLQIIQREHLLARAQREFMRQVELAPRRGIIFDRNQEELAVSLDTESVYARPLGITTPKQTGQLLSQALGMPEDQVVKSLKQERGFAWVARRINPDRAEAVRALELAGIGLINEPRRFYPYSNLACHVLGFAGMDAKGLEGVEAQYDSVLRGQGSKVTSLRDALGRTIYLTPAAFTTLPEGNHVILTLDKRLQYQVEKLLAATVAKYHAAGGQAVVMVPQTGEILAIASLPVFNPNVFGRFPKESFRNRVITDTFEPGSTFKMFVAAAALNTKKAAPNSQYFCENGEWTVGGRQIHDTHEYGMLSLSEIIKFSSNIGAAKVGMGVGAEELYNTIKAFGFGRPSEVDLPGESRGILRPYRSWRPVDLANICFGQGIAVTGLQLVQAVAAVANGGVLMRPYVVKAVVDQSGHLVRENQPQVVGRVMGEREARTLTAMLQEVTEPGGTGTQARVDPFPVAGKTGTAQKLDPSGGYSQSDYMAIFTGFLPADNPKAAVLVVVDTPKGQHYGGVVSGPAWSAIARATMDTLGTQPSSQAAQLVRAPMPPAKTQGLKPRPRPVDPGPALAQGKMPDLRGLTLRDVLRLAREQRLLISVNGWGRVVSQSPEPGISLDLEQELRVDLQPAEGGA